MRSKGLAAIVILTLAWGRKAVVACGTPVEVRAIL
jgi:hypothetical protein